jgi:hypothetical protein
VKETWTERARGHGRKRNEKIGKKGKKIKRRKRGNINVY